MAAIFRWIKLVFFAIFRFLFIGAASVLFCIYTVNYLLNPTNGTNNIVIIIMYFSFLPTFLVLFFEFFFLFRRLSKAKMQVLKEKKIYELQ